jgi:drug/metabolite transporter (DMT)-like permease
VSTLLIGMVLLAAVLHAGWNAIAKWIPDRLVASGLIGAVYAVGGAIGALILPFPSPGAWPFLIASSAVQVGYLLLLTSAYSRGEFGRVYPLARGLSPVLVTIVAWTALGEQLSVGELIGIGLVCGALATLVLVGGLPKPGDGLGLAALTGVAIASYTLLDGVGVTRTDDPLSYAAWLFLLQGPVLVVVCWLLAAPGLAGRIRPHLGIGLLGGLLSLTAYAIVVWAQSFGNLALVAALRETSVLFAGLIATVFFAERQTRLQILALGLAAAGIVIMKVA